MHHERAGAHRRQNEDSGAQNLELRAVMDFHVSLENQM